MEGVGAGVEAVRLGETFRQGHQKNQEFTEINSINCGDSINIYIE